MSAQPTASGRNNPRLAAQQAAPQAEEDARPLSAQLVEAAKAGNPVAPSLPVLPDAPGMPDMPPPLAKQGAAPSRGVPSADLPPEGEDLPNGAPPHAPQLRSMAERRAAAAAAQRERSGRRPGRRRRRWPKVLAACLLLLVLAVALTAGASFVYLRWFAHDDAADIQGTWYLAGTDTPVTIQDGRIHLTDDVSYPYTLDTGDKTIQFSFANLAGAGTYRFSLDRNQLALVDGAAGEADTVAADAAWMLRAALSLLQGDVLPPADQDQEGLTLLSRTPASDTAVSGLPADASTKPKPNTDDGKDAKDSEGDDAQDEGKSGKGKSAKDGDGKDADDASAKDGDGKGSSKGAKSSKDDGKGSSKKDAEGDAEGGSGPDADDAGDAGDTGDTKDAADGAS